MSSTTEVLTISSLGELIEYMKRTEIDHIITNSVGSRRLMELSRPSIEGGKARYIDRNNTIGVCINSNPQGDPLIQAVINHLVTGVATFPGRVDVSTRNLTLYNVIAEKGYNIETDDMNYVLTLACIGVENLNSEQRLRLMIIMKMISIRDNNLIWYKSLIRANPWMRNFDVDFDLTQNSIERVNLNIAIIQRGVNHTLSKPYLDANLGHAHLNSRYNDLMISNHLDKPSLNRISDRRSYTTNYINALRLYGVNPPFIDID
uniref:VP10 protein n=1 Tax=Kadipiro virus TaxID=104580 RepID=A0A8H2SA88_9REOV|nr:MAG: VP10 protein [Kadipiro virus]